jgi:predicted kinase
MATAPHARELIVFVGLQGSGKTTFYNAFLADSHVLVSKDRFRHNRRKERRQCYLVDEALSKGQAVVVDNTNPTAADRAGVIAVAKAHQVQVVAYFFQPDVMASLVRNSQRQGKAYVPAVGIFATAKRLEPPSEVEGFDALFTVIAGENFQFRVVAGIHLPASQPGPCPPSSGGPGGRAVAGDGTIF